MSDYELPVSRKEWAETEIHKASEYACRWCGRPFAMPHDFYDHLRGCPQSPDNRTEEPDDREEVDGNWVTYLGRTVELSDLEMQVLRKERHGS